MKNVLKTIADKREQMSLVYQQLAQYILDNSSAVAGMDISTLAAAANVSTATATRFAISLGCSGYPELKQQLQKVQFNYYTSLDEIADVLKRNPGDTVTDVDEALRGLSKSYQHIDKQLIQQAAEMICSSDKVFLVGNQMSSMFVPYTKYLLGKYHGNLHDISAMTFDDEQLIKYSGGKACTLVFALQRYPNATIKAIRRLNEQNIPMIIISDSNLFPFEDMASIMIYATFKDSLAFAPLMLVYSIVYEIILKVIMLDPEKAEQNVKKFDDYVRENHIYYELERT